MKKITLTLMGAALLLFSGCHKAMEDSIYKVYDDKMMDEVLEEEEFTEFLAIIDKAELRGTVHAYGYYTLFAPTNEAVSSYLRNLGKDISDLTEAEAEDIVRYHLVGNDTIKVEDFVDGRLNSRNFQNRYLTTKTQSDGIVMVDRQAKIVTKSLTGGEFNEMHAANGIVHFIDAVLIPPVQTITDVVRSLPDDEYSILKSYFERSGLSDTLSIVSDSIWYTFFIQDDKAFQDAGITDDSTLLAQLHENQKNSTKNDAELIRDYIGYHSLRNIAPKYVVDLLVSSSLSTLTPEQKPIMFQRNGDMIYLDRLITESINDEGVLLDRDSYYTDLSCANGVIQKIKGNIQVKNRSAYRVYWDIAEQPEIMAMSNFRKAGVTKTFNNGELSEVSWGGTYLATIDYQTFRMPMTQAAMEATDWKEQYVHEDALRFNLNPGTVKWIEFKLPVLMPGEYKMWVCYRRELNIQPKIIFKQEGRDDQVMPYIFNMADYMPTNLTPEEMVVQGWKQYNAKQINSVVCSHLLGTINVEYEGRHSLYIEPIYSNRQGQYGNWDLIQFIPKDEDQTWPRVDVLGNWIYDDKEKWEIFPYGDPPEEPEEGEGGEE